MKTRKWLIVLLAAVLLVSIAGNAFARGQTESTGRKTIAFVPPAMISPYYQQIQRAAQEPQTDWDTTLSLSLRTVSQILSSKFRLLRI